MADKSVTSSPKNQAELKKIKAETDLLELQLVEHSKQNRLELFKSVGTFITTMIAIIGLMVTYYSQHSQLALIEQQHLDEDFSKDIQQFSASVTNASKIISITKLSTYFQPQYEQYHRQIINLFVYYIEADTSQSVQSIIQRELISNASNISLNILLEQNRLIQKDIFSKVQFTHVGLALLPDTAFHKNILSSVKNLEWNIYTIIQSINKIREINGIDFSDIFLGRAPLSEDFSLPSPFNKDLELIPISKAPKLADSLIFNNINFSNAGLSGLTFESCDFKNVNFDKSTLIKTEFRYCSFQGNSSFRDFHWSALMANNGDRLVGYYDDYPIWDNCKINLNNFSPDARMRSHVRLTTTPVFFTKSTWNIKNIDENSKEFFNLTNKN